MYRILFIAWFVGISLLGKCQVLPIDLYAKTSISAGLEVGPHNWGVNFIAFSQLKKNKSLILQISELRSSYDIRYQAQDYFRDATTNQRLFPKSYLLGKKVSLYNIGLLVQNRMLLSMQTRPNEVEVGITYAFGFHSIFAKPYYMQLLNIVQLQDNQFIGEITDQKHSAENHSRFVNPEFIYGRSKWRLGVSETQVIPAISTEVGMSARFGRQENWYKEVYFSTQAFLFSKKIQINVSDFNRNVITSLKLGIRLGKKW